MKKLESLEIITMKKVKERQIRKKYSLTQKGKDLIPILIEYIIWAYKYDHDTEAGEDFVQRAIRDREGLIKGIMASL